MLIVETTPPKWVTAGLCLIPPATSPWSLPIWKRRMWTVEALGDKKWGRSFEPTVCDLSLYHIQKAETGVTSFPKVQTLGWQEKAENCSALLEHQGSVSAASRRHQPDRPLPGQVCLILLLSPSLYCELHHKPINWDTICWGKEQSLYLES